MVNETIVDSRKDLNHTKECILLCYHEWAGKYCKKLKNIVFSSWQRLSLLNTHTMNLLYPIFILNVFFCFFFLIFEFYFHLYWYMKLFNNAKWNNSVKKLKARETWSKYLIFRSFQIKKIRKDILSALFFPCYVVSKVTDESWNSSIINDYSSYFLQNTRMKNTTNT